MILWVVLLRLLADFGKLIIFWRKITVLDSIEEIVHFNTCLIMEQNYTCNSSHQNSWSLTILPAYQVTTVIPYSTFIPGFYNINIVDVHTTNYIHYWKNKTSEQTLHVSVNMMLALQIHIQINAAIIKQSPLSFSISLPHKIPSEIPILVWCKVYIPNTFQRQTPHTLLKSLLNHNTHFLYDLTRCMYLLHTLIIYSPQTQYS